jgi:hypothetical protein
VQLGHGDQKPPVARRGRPPKKLETPLQSELVSSALPFLGSGTGSDVPDQSSSRNP